MADDTKKAGREGKPGGMTRRDFIKAGAAAGAGLAVSQLAFVRNVHAADDLNVGIVGTGRQGMVLIKAAGKIDGVRFKAACDIWKFSKTYASNYLGRVLKTPVKVYEDYREMLAQEKDLDAVLIATPDWMHAPITIDSLEAGRHVYCEKEMSNTLDDCRKMVLAARKTGKLLQIGHQRRSNPRYLRAYNGIANKNIIGRITHCYGQWNRPQRLEADIPKRYIIDDATLKKYGYDTMERFRNWRWYRKFSGGAIADLGSHQVDVFSWFLGCDPKSVMASGGLDYYKDKEWYDNVMAIYEYATAKGTARAYYQVLNTTSYGGFYEVFMGDTGSLQISENAKIGFLFREVAAPKQDWEEKAKMVEVGDARALGIGVGHTEAVDGKKSAEALKAEEDVKKPVHQPHLENFFDAVRGKVKLNCPAEIAWQTAVPILRTNDAVEAGRRIDLTEKDYEV